MISNIEILKDAIEPNKKIILDGREFVKVKVRLYELDIADEDEVQSTNRKEEVANLLLQKNILELQQKVIALEKQNNHYKQLTTYYKKEIDGVVDKYQKYKEENKILIEEKEEQAQKIKNAWSEIHEIRTVMKKIKKSKIELDLESELDAIKKDYQKKLDQKNQQYKDSSHKILESHKAANIFKMEKYQRGQEIKWEKNKAHFRNNIKEAMSPLYLSLHELNDIVSEPYYTKQTKEEAKEKMDDIMGYIKGMDLDGLVR